MKRTGSGRTPELIVISILAFLNAVSAAFGAVGLAAGFLDLGVEVNERLPWSSPALGGAALALVVAVPNALLGLLALRHDKRLPGAAVAVGALTIGWIVVELGFIREISFFHPLYAAIGLVLIGAGARLMRAERAQRQASAMAPPAHT